MVSGANGLQSIYLPSYARVSEGVNLQLEGIAVGMKCAKINIPFTRMTILDDGLSKGPDLRIQL